MSAEKWESVTWDWIEREIVDQLLIANKKGQTSQALDSLLAKQPAAANVPRKDAARPRRSSNNG